MPLPREFYLQDPFVAARELVGAWLCRQMPDGKFIRARICELELYLDNDRACHAFGGRCTPRNDAMFMAGGHAYVYLCYGLHNMLNIVLGPAGTPAAVLIRALEYDDCNGPGKLCKALNITRADNKLDLTVGKKIWIDARDKTPIIKSGTRIGVDYAGTDAGLPYRFLIADSPYISKPIK